MHSTPDGPPIRPCDCCARPTYGLTRPVPDPALCPFPYRERPVSRCARPERHERWTSPDGDDCWRLQGWGQPHRLSRGRTGPLLSPALHPANRPVSSTEQSIRHALPHGPSQGRSHGPAQGASGTPPRALGPAFDPVTGPPTKATSSFLPLMSTGRIKPCDRHWAYHMAHQGVRHGSHHQADQRTRRITGSITGPEAPRIPPGK